MTTISTLDGFYPLMLSLLADPRDCYKVDTHSLECIAARIPAMQHTRRPGDPVFDAAEVLRVAIAVTLCTRACLDKQSPAVRARVAAGAGASPLPGTSGGARVPVNPPRPGPLPPAQRVSELEAL